MEPIISVIIPVYKVEKFLRKCINSVLSQTYQNLEIILIDDGSPDNCPNICEEYAAIDDRIKVVHQKNTGLSEARNAGIRIARGEYIGFVDSDDYIDITMYEKLFDLLKNTDADMAMCNAQQISECGNAIEDNWRKNIYDGVLTREQIFEKLVKRESAYYVTAWNKLYKRSIFENIVYPKGKLHEDEFVIHEILYLCNKIVITKEVLYYYVQRESSIVSQKVTYKRLDAVEAVYNRLQFCKEKEELEKYIPRVGEHLCEVYVNIIGKVKIQNKNEQLRLNRIKEMYKEAYGYCKKELFTLKKQIKFRFPKICSMIIMYRSLKF